MSIKADLRVMLLIITLVFVGLSWGCVAYVPSTPNYDSYYYSEPPLGYYGYGPSVSLGFGYFGSYGDGGHHHGYWGHRGGYPYRGWRH